MGRVSREARYCFILLWTIADDTGRLRGNSRMLASLLYPYDDDAKRHIIGWLEELEREECVRRYRVEGQDYVLIVNWADHQKIDRPSPSRIPAPLEPSSEPSSETPAPVASPREHSSGDRDLEGTKDLDHGPSASVTAREVEREFSEFYEAFPKKIDRGDALKAFRQARKKASAAEILEGARRYARARVGEDPQYTKGPAAWLRAEKWADEAPRAVRVNGHTGGSGPIDTSGEGSMAALSAENRRRNKLGLPPMNANDLEAWRATRAQTPTQEAAT